MTNKEITIDLTSWIVAMLLIVVALVVVAVVAIRRGEGERGVMFGGFPAYYWRSERGVVL